jgi:hypothetical protein
LGDRGHQGAGDDMSEARKWDGEGTFAGSLGGYCSDHYIFVFNRGRHDTNFRLFKLT